VLEIRPARLNDLPGLYRVCLQTGDAGRDATRLYRNPDLLGHVYVGPYVIGQPRLAYAAADSLGVAGYVLGASDTRAFEAWEEENWWPALREQYPLTTETSPDAELIRHIHAPSSAPDGVIVRYPAHLHIDLLDRARGQGLGRRMVETVLTSLRASGASAVHLDVASTNDNAIEFYRHLGFAELARASDSTYMGLSLR
jgi:ribosomal protein S18 acetylase RimI-like enzyme